MDVLLFLLALVVVAAVAFFLLRRRRPAAGPAEEIADEVQISFAQPGRAVVTMPAGSVDASTASESALQRLVSGVARSILAQHPDINEVEVRNAAGDVLGVTTREEEVVPEGAGDDEVPHDRLGGPGLDLRTPDPREAGAHLEPSASRPLAERLQLPGVIAGKLSDPDDPVELVEAILRHGGRSPTRDGDVLRVDGQALVVLRIPYGSRVSEEDLNRAYMRFKETGAKRGLVVAAGVFSQREIVRRQAMDKSLRHAGLDAMQRMADAAASGADPLLFALPDWSQASGRPRRR